MSSSWKVMKNSKNLYCSDIHRTSYSYSIWVSVYDEDLFRVLLIFFFVHYRWDLLDISMVPATLVLVQNVPPQNVQPTKRPPTKYIPTKRPSPLKTFSAQKAPPQNVPQYITPPCPHQHVQHFFFIKSHLCNDILKFIFQMCIMVALI
jgi:hypothetical protein